MRWTARKVTVGARGRCGGAIDEFTGVGGKGASGGHFSMRFITDSFLRSGNRW
jgi:hypothetical protein